MQTNPPRPLEGVTVVDLGQVYQGPYATFLMAKAGADVIKVEPMQGEPARSRAEINQGAMLPFEMLNANKKGIAIDLKAPAGKDILISLVSSADVLVENFAPGAMDRLGLGWDVLHNANPRLIYASGTGYGLSGPDRDGLAMDITVQAMSGMMSVTGLPDSPPLKCGPAVADFAGGTHLYAAIVTALFDRERTGRGCLVEVAMQEAVFFTLASSLGMAFGKGGSGSQRTGNRHSGLAIAPYNVYSARDGYVAIINLQEAHWLALLKVMGRIELTSDPRFSSNKARVANMAETDALVEHWTSRHTTDEIFQLAKANRVPCAPVREISQVLADAHMHERGMLEWVDHPRLGRTVLPNSPLRFHGVEQATAAPSPQLGEHTSKILRERLGLDPHAIAELMSTGVIGGTPE